jgi:hypothetical protein
MQVCSGEVNQKRRFTFMCRYCHKSKGMRNKEGISAAITHFLNRDCTQMKLVPAKMVSDLQRSRDARLSEKRERQQAHAGRETVLLKDAGLWGTLNQERESAVLVEERVAEAAAEEKRTALKRRRRRSQ